MSRRLLFFALLAACTVLAAALSQRHTWQIDLTAQRMHSLSPAARAALDALSAPLEITAFVPEFAVQRAEIERLLAPYLAHPGRPVLRFVDPVAQPTLAREMGVTRHGELQLATDRRREVVAIPSVAAIDRALNRLALQGERWVVIYKGHGESMVDDRPAGLGRLVARIEDLGYRSIALDPRHTEAIPDNAAVLLIAAPQADYSEQVQAQIGRFVARGGALLWLLDGPLPEIIGQQFGIGLLPGVLVDAAAAQHGLDHPDNAIVSDYPNAVLPHPPERHGVFKQARALTFSEGDQWQPVGRLLSSPRSWNETGSLRGRIARNVEAGELAGPLTVGLALQSRSADPPQRAIFIGGRHFISNDQIGQGANMGLAIGLINWLTANPLAADPAAATDLDIHWSPTVAGPLALTLMGLLPAAYLLLGLWWRGRRGRA